MWKTIKQSFVYLGFAVLLLFIAGMIGLLVKQMRDQFAVEKRANQLCAPFQVYNINYETKEVVCYTADKTIVLKHLE